jgi:predicted nucleotidyltransferase
MDSADWRDATRRFTAACADDDAVVAAYLGGSHAAGTADEVSDLDLYLVTSERDYEAFFARHEEFMRRWCEPLSLEAIRDFEGLGFDMLLFVCRDGVWGEVATAHIGNFAAAHGGAYEVLVDETGLLDGVEFPLWAPGEDERREAARHAVTRFWHDALQLHVLVVRGREVAAAAKLAQLRAHVATLGELVGDDGAALAATTRTSDLGAMRDAALELVGLHAELGARAARAVGIAYPHELPGLVTGRLASRGREEGG